MTSEGLGEMCRKIIAHVDGRPSGGSHVHRHGSKDPHWLELKFIIMFQKRQIQMLAIYIYLLFIETKYEFKILVGQTKII
jgi:hypothetical protein